MRSTWSLTALAAALVLLAASPADAGPRDPAGPQPVTDAGDPPAAANPRRAARRERVRQRIRAMRAWYLTEQLQLDDTTAGRLFPLLGQYDDRIAAVHQRGVQLRRALRREMSAPRPAQPAIDHLLDELLTHYDNLYRVQRERLVAVRKVVTPAQTAKLVLLLPRLDDAVRRQIQRAMRGRRMGPAGQEVERRGDAPRRDRIRRRRGPDRDEGEGAPPFTDPF
ncbi:MAG TPA: hypothetical protein VK698_36200 [Kofleriaceae bacterium]|nr:hypothetical protein [Kofleriaceae bacterium]